MDNRTKQAKKVKAAYEKVFESDDGKIVLLDLIESTGLMGPSLNTRRQIESGLEMAFNDGAKSIVTRIIQQVKMKPEKFLDILEQKQQEEFQL